MKKQIEHVKMFHDTFGIKNNYKPVAELGEEIFLLRHRLMREENEEYLEACENGDLIEIADNECFLIHPLEQSVYTSF